MRTALVLVVLFAACGGTSAITGDGGTDAPGGPAGWTCDPHDYQDGHVCHCGCGIVDPDCSDPSLIVSGCLLGDVCSTAGTCTSCGNGVVDPGEACDAALPATAECAPLGYAAGEVGCAASCQWAYDQCTPLVTCGNGMLDANELCDGTAIKAGTTCSTYGRTSGTLSCQAGCTIDTSACYTCGDGQIEGPEICDDGGTSPGDGCSMTCTVESGWTCSGAPSQCAPICGDGKIEGTEGCDDGGTTSGDGCSATCQVEQDCQCAGTPSTCSCAYVQTVATPTESIDTGALVVDSNGPHAVYAYGDGYSDPVTHVSMEHVHLEYAERPATSWSTSEIQTWDQIQASLGPEQLAFSGDGGALRVYFNRLYNTAGTFAVATRAGATWQLAYDNPYYVYDVIRGGGAWQSIAAVQQFGGLQYEAGDPGAWTRDETLPAGFTTGYPLHLGYASTGDVYITAFTPASGHASYDMKVSKRVDATTWSTVYDVTTTAAPSACVYPVSHQALALGGGEMVFFEDGFNASGTRWLRAHRLVGASWVVEDVADLSFLSSMCTASGASYSTWRKAVAMDPQGQPHIMFAAKPYLDSQAFEDHYRDASGWHVRTFPITHGAPLDMVIDAAGTTHVLAIAAGPSSTTRLVYVRISAGSW